MTGLIVGLLLMNLGMEMLSWSRQRREHREFMDEMHRWREQIQRAAPKEPGK